MGPSCTQISSEHETGMGEFAVPAATQIAALLGQAVNSTKVTLNESIGSNSISRRLSPRRRIRPSLCSPRRSNRPSRR